MLPIPLIFSTGWASGINSYAVVLVLGLLSRFGHQAAVPSVLGRTDVLIAASLAFACQFVAGKIPYFDSLWDIVHTAVRPVMGGALGVLMAHQAHASPTQTIAAAALGGGAAVTTHVVKTGVRMGVNVSPEPVSTMVASLVEDGTVAVVVTFAVLHPVPAAIITGFLLILGLTLLILLASRIRRAWRARRAKRERRRSGSLVGEPGR